MSGARIGPRLMALVQEAATKAVAEREARLTINDSVAELALTTAAAERKVVSITFCGAFRDEAAIVLEDGTMFTLSAKAGMMVHQHNGERLVCPDCSLQVSEYFDSEVCPRCQVPMQRQH